MADGNFIPDMFLQFPGAEGELKIEGFESTIGVVNYDFSVNAVSTQGQGSGQKGGKGTMTPIYITLLHDKGYAKLRKLAGQGIVTTGEVVLTRTADGNKDEVITLTNTKVVSANSSHGTGAQNTASVVLTFDTAKVQTYVDNGTQFVIGDSTTYDLAKGQTD